MRDIIDHKEVETLRSEVGNEDFTILLTSFYREADSRLKAIEIHVADSDHNGLELDSHTLKSLSRTFGAIKLGKGCEKLEKAAKNRQSEHYDNLLGQIKGETVESLRSLKKRYGS